MQVAGDAVAVGLHLQPALALLAADQLQRHRRLGGERGGQVEQLRLEGLQVAPPHDHQRAQSRGPAQRDQHGRAVLVGEQRGERGGAGGQALELGVGHQSRGSRPLRIAEDLVVHRHEHALGGGAVRADGRHDAQRPVVTRDGDQDPAGLRPGEFGDPGRSIPQHLVGIDAAQQPGGDVQAGLGPGPPSLGPLEQPGVVDGQPGHGGQRLRHLDVGLGERAAALLLGQVQVAEDGVTDADGDPEEGPHDRVPVREAPEGRVVGQVRQPEGDRLGHQQAEQALPRGGCADAPAVVLVHALDDEPVQPAAVGAQHAQRAVPRLDVPDRRAEDLVQGRLEVAAGGGGEDGGRQLRCAERGGTGHRSTTPSGGVTARR